MTDVPAILDLAGQFGPLGLLIAYLIWRDRQDRAERKELDTKKSAERAVAAADKRALDRERLEADKALAASLASLTAVIQGLKR